MEKEYNYSKSYVIKKLVRALLLIIASILFDIVMVGENLIQNILVWLVYISAAALFIIDCLPGIIHIFKAKYEKIIIENLSLYFAIEKDEKEVMVERFRIKEVIFKAFLTKDIEIPAAKPVEDIDESIYKLPGRRFVIITEDGEEYTIYLEILDDEFIEDFIDWYQGNQVF